MLRSIDMGWFIINKYYSCADDVPIYATALLLDPSKRAAYLRQNWAPAWVKPAIDAGNAMWQEEFNFEATVDSAASDSTPDYQEDEWEALARDLRVPIKAPACDSFMSFVEEPVISIDCSPLEWWCQETQKLQFPRLSRMAITLLSIPAESAKAERVFSGAQRTCSWDRLRLTCDKIEKIECVGNWLRQGVIKPSAAGGIGIVDAVDDGDSLESIVDYAIAELESFE